MTISTTAPPAITAAADMLAASSTWSTMVGAGNELASIYYPHVDEQDVTLPAAALFPTARSKHKFIVGAPGLDGGSLTLVIHVPIDTLDDALEVAAEAILKDILANDTGLAIQDGSVEPAEEPTPGERAANESPSLQGARSITITLDYGLTA